MATAAVQMKLTGKWAKMRVILSPKRLAAATSVEVSRATEQNAMFTARAIRRYIKAAKVEANAAATIAMKGSSKPLVHTGQMFQSIKGSLINSTTALAGVLRTAKSEDGAELANVAAILNEGATIPVTESMRGLFYALHTATTRGRGAVDASPRLDAILGARGGSKEVIWPLDEGTEEIDLPARPFFEDSIDSALKARIRKNWERAYQRALTKYGVK